MILKEIGRKIAQAFRLAKAADEKVTSSIATSLDTIAEQAKEYEKHFEPGPPEPDPMQEAAAQVGVDVVLIANALHRPEPVSHLANNWRKMHGLPMRRKRRRRK